MFLLVTIYDFCWFYSCFFFFFFFFFFLPRFLATVAVWGKEKFVISGSDEFSRGLF